MKNVRKSVSYLTVLTVVAWSFSGFLAYKVSAEELNVETVPVVQEIKEEVKAPAAVKVVAMGDSTYSPWCSALLGIVSQALNNAPAYNTVADVSPNDVIDLSDLILAQQWHVQGLDNTCSA
ncbi:hypothetical protein K8R42_04550, partial [bacterium]|nr:hypothetical protein [bacterium]